MNYISKYKILNFRFLDFIIELKIENNFRLDDKFKVFKFI